MGQRIYISYGGDEQEIGSDEDFDAGLVPSLSCCVIEDIIADMRHNYADTAEITITIR